jgi:hypothetical protein
VPRKSWEDYARLYDEGWSYEMIALDAGVAIATARTHVKPLKTRTARLHNTKPRIVNERVGSGSIRGARIARSSVARMYRG